MISPQHARSFFSARRQQRALCAGVLGVWLYAGCSVYDASLLPSSGALGGGSAEAGSSNGAVAGSSDSGGSGGSGPGEVGGGGSANNVSGASNGATSASGATAGTSAVLEGGAPSAGAPADGGASDGGAPTAPVPQELALGKTSLASSNQTDYGPALGNDGNVATRWCAVNGNFPQWWRVDLGAAHQLESFSVRFEYPERAHSYVIETSQDDVTYAPVAGTTATDVVGEVQAGTFADGSSARYVRISVTNAAPPTDPNEQPHVTWASFFEFSVLGF